MSTLLITEKSKAARAIAEALGNFKTIQKHKLLYVYFIPSKDLVILPLRGHILEYNNTEQFKSWTNSDPRNIITDTRAIEKRSKNFAKPYIKALKEYGSVSDHCIIGTDADTEGCNIGLLEGLKFMEPCKLAY